MLYSRRLGDVSREIKTHGIEVTDDLKRLSSVPDVIHGQHHPLIMETLLQFPAVPAVFVCHAARGFTEAPVFFPRILRYVGVDDRCRLRLENTPEIPAHRIDVILNAVDLDRFRPRGPLPRIPRRAAVFSNNASRFSHLPAVRKACRELGLELEVLGRQSGNPVANPEAFLPRYDIVFAKARCALEAMAVGSAVVLCDYAGAGPLVATKNFDSLRPMNFGTGALLNPIEAKFLRGEIEHYDAADAAAVSARVRNEADLRQAALQWLKLYTEVIEEFSRMKSDPAQEAAVAKRYFQQYARARRLEWAKTQFRKVRSIPLVGVGLHHLSRRLAREWTKNPEL